MHGAPIATEAAHVCHVEEGMVHVCGCMRVHIIMHIIHIINSCTYTYTYIYIYVYVFMYMYIYVCVFMFMYMYVCIHACVYNASIHIRY